MIFPFLSPWSVWDIPYHLWVGYAAAIDAEVTRWKEQAR